LKTDHEQLGIFDVFNRIPYVLLDFWIGHENFFRLSFEEKFGENEKWKRNYSMRFFIIYF